MEITTIIILSLAVVWLILSIIRDANRSKWFTRGYVAAAIKYDEKDDYRKKTYSEEGEEVFYEAHGFHYD